MLLAAAAASFTTDAESVTDSVTPARVAVVDTVAPVRLYRAVFACAPEKTIGARPLSFSFSLESRPETAVAAVAAEVAVGAVVVEVAVAAVAAVAVAAVVAVVELALTQYRVHPVIKT